MKSFLALCAITLTLSTPASAKVLHVGVAMSRSAQLFLVKIRAAMEQDARRNGVSLQVEDAAGDVGRQLDQVRNFIANGVDAIIVNAVDTSATDGMTRIVTKAGIPLVYVNLGPDLGTKLPPNVSVVVSDHGISGRLEMEGLARCMRDKGDVGILLGDLASNATDQRTKGNKEVISKHPDIRIIEEQTANFNRNQAIDLVRDWLTKGDTFNGLAANNDEMAIGAIFALQQAGYDPRTMCIGGIDATEDALAQMKLGNLAVSVFQDAKGQGRIALETAIKMVKGEKTDPFVVIPYELVTPDNMKDYLDR